MYRGPTDKWKPCGRPKDHKGSHGPFKPKLRDKNGAPLKAGDEVFFVTGVGVLAPAVVQGRDNLAVDRISCMIKDDPFPVGVLPDYLIKKEDMPNKVKPDRKELRKQAKALKIKGYEEMTGKQLIAAIAKATDNGKTTKVPRGHTKADKGEPVTPAQKAKAGKGKTSKATSTKKNKTAKAKSAIKDKMQPTVAENGNPFRPGTNNFLFTEQFLKGGVRAKLIEKLIKKVTFRPWAKKLKDIDPAHEMDKRMLMCTHQLQHKHQFTVVHYGGRGPEKASIRVFPPGVDVPAELVAKATMINGVRPGQEKKVKAKKTTKKAAAAKKAPATKKAASKPKASTTKPAKKTPAKRERTQNPVRSTRSTKKTSKAKK